MSLRSLVLCSDEKIIRALRRTLGDLEIDVELCMDADSALRKLTRTRFEAIIVDCEEKGAADVLRSSRTSACNQRAVSVAIVGAQSGLRSVFELGAHFVLYKPVSMERSRSSFRAARALMNRERRRNVRVPVSVPVTIDASSGSTWKVNTTDLSEGGMSVKLPRRSRPSGICRLSFTLPGTRQPLNLKGEFAWEGNTGQAGLRFVDVSTEDSTCVGQWLKRNSADPEPDDALRCQLTDLSLGGCYLEISSPFPVSTRVTISMKVPGIELRTAGLVRVMHPEKGMGVEFTRTTPELQADLERLLSALTDNHGVTPEVMVEPEGIDRNAGNSADWHSGNVDDPLLKLFRQQPPFSQEAFEEELRKQRGGVAAVSA